MLRYNFLKNFDNHAKQKRDFRKLQDAVLQKADEAIHIRRLWRIFQVNRSFVDGTLESISF